MTIITLNLIAFFHYRIPLKKIKSAREEMLDSGRTLEDLGLNQIDINILNDYFDVFIDIELLFVHHIVHSQNTFNNGVLSIFEIYSMTINIYNFGNKLRLKC